MSRLLHKSLTGPRLPCTIPTAPWRGQPLADASEDAAGRNLDLEVACTVRRRGLWLLITPAPDRAPAMHSVQFPLRCESWSRLDTSYSSHIVPPDPLAARDESGQVECRRRG